MSEWDEFTDMIEEESFEEETLPYNIKKREVYYVCLFCGKTVTKSKLDQQDNVMCPYCGNRILIKIRSPTVPPRRVYAI